MKITLSNCIRIEEPTQEIRAYCKDKLVIDNPDYISRQRMGKWVGSTPRYLHLYEEIDGNLYVPYGCKKDICRMIPFGTERVWSKHHSACDLRAVFQSNVNLYPYQENAVQAMLDAKNGIVVMPCGSGKGLPIDAKICTPTGWKRNGDLQIGDAVVGSNGKATRVTRIFDRGQVDAYKITFSDGVETVCDKDHLWTVQKQSQRVESHNWNVMDTQSIYEHYQNMKCRSQYLYIPIVEPVEFYCYSKSEQKMNPWLLGFLLGDGCFQKSMITMSTAEDDLRKKVIDIISKDYGSCEWLINKSKYDWRFCGGYVFHAIKDIGLYHKHSHEKFIPAEYLYSSAETRLSVLRGLFDADGHINSGNTFEYCTTSKQLADDVVFIVESLGGTAKVKEKIPTYTYNGEKCTGRKAYRIFFKLYNFKPFTSKKHSAVYRERTHFNSAYRIIKKIEPCEPIISRCITVDAKDQLYVIENFVVTHNTQTALECVSRIGLKTLWLTHTQDLLNQSMERAKGCFDCDDDMFGTITAGKVKIGKGITFATVQTMCKLDLNKYRTQWAVVIVDECQHCCGSPTRVSQFYKVVNSLYAPYKFGLTATPHRTDGLDKSMYALLGDICFTVSKADVKDTTCPVNVECIDIGYIPDCDVILNGDGTINYTALTDDLINNHERFLKAVVIMNSECRTYSIVLANRIAYLKQLQESYAGKSICISSMGTSKKAKQERKEALARLNSGEIDCIFATYQLAAEGLDCPNLRCVMFATPEKNERTVTQAVGRVARKADGKQCGKVIDLVDSFGMYQGWAKKRKNYYKKLDCIFL